MSDLISRKAVLESLSVFSDKEHGNEHFLAGIESAKEIVTSDPDAVEWISVEERLPEEDDIYLASIYHPVLDEHSVAIEWCADGEWDLGYQATVTAWMPLPEPYTKAYGGEK